MIRYLFIIGLSLIFLNSNADELDDLKDCIHRIEVLFKVLTPEYLRYEEAYQYARNHGIKASVYANDEMEAIMFTIQRIDLASEDLVELSERVRLSPEQNELMMEWAEVYGKLMEGVNFEYDQSKYPTTADYLYDHPYDWKNADNLREQLNAIRLKLFPE